MSDENSRNLWTDNEKLGFILQLVAKLPKIPWDELDLPEGRTQKACQVMLDKEKQKIKKANASMTATNGGDGVSPEKTTNNKKRKPVGDAGDKKSKSPRTTKKAVIKQEHYEDGSDSENMNFDI